MTFGHFELSKEKNNIDAEILKRAQTFNERFDLPFDK
jgi:hypothetical protein